MEDKYNLKDVIDDFDMELYNLEERYLKLFKRYPVLNNINKENLGEIKKKLRHCVDNNIEYHD